MDARLLRLNGLIASPDVLAWSANLLRSRRGHWGREDAIEGLRRAAIRAVGNVHDVTVDVRSPLRESVVKIDGEPFSIRFISGL